MNYTSKFKDLYKSLINNMNKNAAGFTPLTKLTNLIYRPVNETILLFILVGVVIILTIL
jgi:hypothetical protein